MPTKAKLCEALVPVGSAFEVCGEYIDDGKCPYHGAPSIRYCWAKVKHEVFAICAWPLRKDGTCVNGDQHWRG